MLFPFHNYLGPGNLIDNGAPVDPDDEIALSHDMAYEAATSPEQIRRADEEAIADFSRNYTSTGNWHSAVGAMGLSLKYQIEGVTGVLYPPLDNGPGKRVLLVVLSAYTTGVMGLLVGHPLDTIKIRSQTMPDKGLGQIVINTFKLEGLRGFYKGFLAPMLSTGVTGAIFFGVYGNTLRVLRNYYGYPPESQCEGYLSHPMWHWDEFLSGAFAGAINTVVSAPVEAIKTRMQANAAVDSFKFKMGNECGSTWSTIKFIQSKEGLPGFCRGGLALLMRDVPSYGVYTATYTLLFESFKCSIPSSTLACGLAGGFAGMISWALVMPFDVVKSSLQGDNLTNPKYKGVVDCFRQNYQQYGLRIFMRGFSITVMRAFPVNYVTFLTYEEFKRHCFSL